MLLIEDLSEYLQKKKEIEVLMDNKKKLYAKGTPSQASLKKINDRHAVILEELERTK